MLAELRLSGGINALAHQLGERPAVIFDLVEEQLPSLLKAFREFAGGLNTLIAMLERSGGSTLAAAVMGHEQVDPGPGQEILRQLPIGKLQGEPHEPSSEQALRDRLLPLLIMLAGGYLAARASAGNWKRGELAGLLEASVTRPPQDEDQV